MKAFDMHESLSQTHGYYSATQGSRFEQNMFLYFWRTELSGHII